MARVSACVLNLALFTFGAAAGMIGQTLMRYKKGFQSSQEAANSHEPSASMEFSILVDEDTGLPEAMEKVAEVAGLMLKPRVRDTRTGLMMAWAEGESLVVHSGDVVMRVVLPFSELFKPPVARLAPSPSIRVEAFGVASPSAAAPIPAGDETDLYVIQGTEEVESFLNAFAFSLVR